MDYDVIVIGGGPAGLTAAARLGQSGRRALVIERESFGGQPINTEWIEDYPRPGERVEGPALASRWLEAAEQGGVEMELGEAVELESYSGCRSVRCESGKTYTASVVIVAGGLRPRKLGVPGEDAFQGKGVIHCAFCDAGFYSGKEVAVSGGGDAGVIEALLLAKYASRVHLFEQGAALTAAPRLVERAKNEPKLALHLGERIGMIEGDSGVTGVTLSNGARLAVHGVLPRVGFEAPSEYLQGVVALDGEGRVEADPDLRTDAAGILAAGDIRSGSSRSVAAAVADGERAAATALKLLTRGLRQGRD